MTRAQRMLNSFKNQLMVLLTVCVGASATVSAYHNFRAFEQEAALDAQEETAPAESCGAPSRQTAPPHACTEPPDDAASRRSDSRGTSG